MFNKIPDQSIDAASDRLPPTETLLVEVSPEASGFLEGWDTFEREHFNPTTIVTATTSDFQRNLEKILTTHTATDTIVFATHGSPGEIYGVKPSGNLKDMGSVANINGLLDHMVAIKNQGLSTPKQIVLTGCDVFAGMSPDDIKHVLNISQQLGAEIIGSVNAVNNSKYMSGDYYAFKPNGTITHNVGLNQTSIPEIAAANANVSRYNNAFFPGLVAELADKPIPSDYGASNPIWLVHHKLDAANRYFFLPDALKTPAGIKSAVSTIESGVSSVPPNERLGYIVGGYANTVDQNLQNKFMGMYLQTYAKLSKAQQLEAFSARVAEYDQDDPFLNAIVQNGQAFSTLHDPNATANEITAGEKVALSLYKKAAPQTKQIIAPHIINGIAHLETFLPEKDKWSLDAGLSAQYKDDPNLRNPLIKRALGNIDRIPVGADRVSALINIVGMTGTMPAELLKKLQAEAGNLNPAERAAAEAEIKNLANVPDSQKSALNQIVHNHDSSGQRPSLQQPPAIIPKSRADATPRGVVLKQAAAIPVDTRAPLLPPASPLTIAAAHHAKPAPQHISA